MIASYSPPPKRIFCSLCILKYVIPTVNTLNSIKADNRTARIIVALCRRLLLSDRPAIRFKTCVLLFLSMKTTPLSDLPVLNAHDPVCHLGDILIMGDQNDRLLKLLRRRLQ